MNRNDNLHDSINKRRIWGALRQMKSTDCGEKRQVEKQAGERNGVAEASPFRFTADGNADRIRVLRLFRLRQTLGVVKPPECLLSGL